MKIYTKKGDRGESGLADGEKLPKDDVVFEVLGMIDELSSWLGFVGAGLPTRPWGGSSDPPLRKIQKVLFMISGIIAKSKKAKIDIKEEIKWLENEIDKMEKELPALSHFILPGGSELAARLHVARTVCRRCERVFVTYSRINTRIDFLIPYFNRLSDYLFTLARWANK